MPRAFIALTALLLAAGAATSAGCGDGGGSASPSPPMRPSTSPTATPVIPLTVIPTPAALAPTSILDMASDAPVLTIVPADAGDLRTGGDSLARGDFNNDGVDDLLLGAPFGDGPNNSREDSGEAYVIFGSGRLGEDIDLGRATADLTIFGALPGDNLGVSVISGDLNGDGIDDVVVGAPGSNGLTNIRTDLGEAYIIFGSPSLGGTVDLAKIEQDFTLRPAEGFTRVGTTFAIGDVNGDGIDDLIAGGPFGGRVEGTAPGSRRTTEGEVYIVFGAPDLRGEKDVARSQEDVRLKGAQEFDSFGQAVTSGDVNGDGVDDIIVTATRADGPEDSRAQAGEAYVFFGSPSLYGKVDSDEADITIYGSEEGDTLGDPVASGDVTGDGLADIILGARFADGPDNLRSVGGEAYVIWGSPSLGGIIDLGEEEPDSLVYAADPADMMPSSLTVLDLDDDGRDDVVLGAAFADGPGNMRSDGGEAYALHGDALEGEIDLRVDVDGPLFIYGSGAGEQMGTGLLWLDLDDNGRQELLLLAPGGQGEGQQPGRLYLVEVEVVAP